MPGSASLINREIGEGLLRKWAQFLFKAKCVVLVVLLVTVLSVEFFRFFELRAAPVGWALFLELVVCACYFLVQARKPEWALPFTVVSLFVDVVAVTVGLHYLGGVYSMIWGVDYLFLVAVASVFLSRAGRITYLTFSLTAYSLLVYLEHAGLISRLDIYGISASGKLDFICWLSTVCVIVLAAVVSGNLAEVLNRFYGQSRLGRLTTEIAHEIRTPLQAIEGYAERGGVPEPVRLQIGCQVERIARFIKEVVALGREEAPKRIAVPIQPVVDHALETVWQALNPGHGIRLERESPGEALSVHIDVDQMTKALCNLLRNAVEAMSRQGDRLSVRVARNGFEWARVEIRDTGAGIDKGEIRKVFEPFYTTKGGTRGAGLGLAIAKKLTEANGGTLEVESEIGRGTVFVVNLPLYAG